MLFGKAKDQQFFQLLRAAAENMVAVTIAVNELLNDPKRYPDLGPAVKELESKGDRLTHDMFALINKSFSTPLERQDLASIAVDIDSVVDAMEAAVARIGIYKVRDTDRFLKAFGHILRSQATELVASIDLVAGSKYLQIHDRAVQINLLENQGDETLRAALSGLFEQAAGDPVRFITMKEIYETLEEATDRAEDVANTLEGVVMKHG